MLFNSYVFIFCFLPAALMGWWLLRGTSLRLIFITLASYVFYSWWDWRFLPLMIASTTVDYIAGGRIAASDSVPVRKRWLVYSLTFNLAILGFFKYYGFFADSVDRVATGMGIAPLLPVLHLVLPIGISFYTFNSMSYTIDIYRRLVRPAKSALHFSAFVALFPHLIAGPIVRYSDIEDQFARLKDRLSGAETSLGIYFFVIGLAKKMLIADRLAGPVAVFFDGPGRHGLVPAWLAVLGYTFQLYFDFSGYSDMAVGLAHLLGIQFPQNFNSPYKADNISDFWRRWHMSLSSWLRDYLFIPLGGSRGSVARTTLNLGITMFLGGLWHGANWTFVIWGLYHGVLLGGHALATRRGWVPQSRLEGRILTFFTVMLGWVVFRAESLGRAREIFAEMAGAGGLGSVHFFRANYIASLALAAILAFFFRNSWEIKIEPRRTYAYALAVMLIGAVLLLGRGSPFLYFQF
jgi:alginate O-acetyltransferase complex protein AlgI